MKDEAFTLTLENGSMLMALTLASLAEAWAEYESGRRWAIMDERERAAEVAAALAELNSQV